MAITRHSGPLIVSGSGTVQSGGDYNEVAGPSLFASGIGLADTRYMPPVGGDVSNVFAGWAQMNELLVLDQAPSTISAVNIVAAAAPTAGTPMTLAAAATGITVVAAGGFSLAGGFPSVAAGALCIDGSPVLMRQAGTLGGTAVYDPRTMIARNLRVTSAGTDTGGFMTIRGADVYGQPLTELFTLAGAGVIAGKKAFKFVTQCLPSGTLSGANISVGTGDVYGFPLASYEWQQATVYWAGTLISASTGYLAAVTTSPATNITGDVRGTYATQSASNGTNNLVVYVTPAPWNLSQTGIFGVTQYGG